MRAKDKRFGLTARFFKVVDVLFQTRFLQTLARGWVSRRGNVVIDLPGHVAPGVYALMNSMGDIDNLIALVFQPGVDRALHHHAHRYK